MEKRTKGTANRGSASTLLLGALAFLLLSGVAAWFLLGPSDGPATETAIQPAAEVDERPAPPDGMLRQSDLDAMEANGPRTVGGLETRPAGGYEPFEKVFGDVGGTVIGEIRVRGAEYPEVWTVTLEPSLLADGRDEAVTRSFTAEPGMRTFEFRDLPLAAYRVSARAPGLATAKVELALYRVKERPGQSGLDFVNLDLTLQPMAKVEGFVRQSDGNAAHDLAIYLVPYHVNGALQVEVEGDDRRNLKVVTNSAGSYSFDQVAPGPWMLHVGDPLRPLASPIPVGVQTADQRVDDLSLPPLATLHLVVLDSLARPCPNVEMTGYLKGSGSGSFKVKTDAVGEIHVPYLAPGPWHVEAKDVQFKQKGQGDFVLSPEGSAHGRIEEIHIRE